MAARVYTSPDQSQPGLPPPQRFASGTADLTLYVEMKADSPPQVNVDFEVWSQAGKVELTGGYGSWAAIPAERTYTARLAVKAKAGKFADGAHQMKLLMDAKEVAVLNWSIGP